MTFVVIGLRVNLELNGVESISPQQVVSFNSLSPSVDC